MRSWTRRQFLKAFARLAGCFVAFATAPFVPARTPAGRSSGEVRFPQGVASGDPTPSSVVLWTRAVALHGPGEPVPLRLQVARSPDFHEVVSDVAVTATAASDHTVRVLVERLDAGTIYFYRFLDGAGVSSLTGRTRTAPPVGDERPVHFAFASCQDLQLGHFTPYRRMIAEDIERPEDERIQFLLHLGDFIYEETWYPEERATFLHRPVRPAFRFPDGGGGPDLRWPVSLRDYRAVYKAYLEDPDLQAARARWPFICIWDDHEFTNNGWQSQAMYGDQPEPAQSRKVAANQAWSEFIPAQLTSAPGSSGVPSPARDFRPVEVDDSPVTEFDEHFLGRAPDNLAAIGSLIVNRSLRWGQHVDLILTDNRGFRSPPPVDPTTDAAMSRRIRSYLPQSAIEVLDAGREAGGGEPPTHLEYAGEQIPNPRRSSPPGTMLGAEQKAWWKASMSASDATWRVWGNSLGLIPRRLDFHRLEGEASDWWPADSHGIYSQDDWDGYPSERRELMRFLQQEGIGNVVSLAGDRHVFDAGLVHEDPWSEGSAPAITEFGVSSICTPNVMEVYRYIDRNLGPFRDLFLHQPEGTSSADEALPAVNLAFRYGMGAAEVLRDTRDLGAAQDVARPVNPGMRFFDGAHFGFALARVDSRAFDCEFVAFEAPLEPSDSPGGPPVIYRISHRVWSWRDTDGPSMSVIGSEGLLPIPYGPIEEDELPGDIDRISLPRAPGSDR